MTSPERVYTPQPIQIHPGQAYSPAQGYQGPHTVVVYQQPPVPRSWARTHAPDIALGIGATVAVTVLLVALAAFLVALATAAVTLTVAVVVVKSVFDKTPDTKK